MKERFITLEDPDLAYLVESEPSFQAYIADMLWAQAYALGNREAMMDRALAFNEAFDYGAIHTYFITYEMSRSGGTGDPAARSRQHFERALALSGGQQAGPMVSFAEAVCVQKQDLKEFEALLKQALAINPDARPEWRLANLVMQRRAEWLL